MRRWGGWGEGGSECVGWEGVRAVVSWGGWVRRWSEDEVLKVMYW